MEQKLESRINELITALIESYPPSTHMGIEFEVRVAKKYAKIVMHNTSTRLTGDTVISGTSVHAFVCLKSGALLKSASWRAPAKGPRYWLLDDIDFPRCLKAADWAGGYLYR